MRILKFWHRLHAELAAAQAAWKADRERSRLTRYRRALRKRRVVLPSPRPDAVAGNWYGDRKAQ